jgi:hypothetical protein
LTSPISFPLQTTPVTVMVTVTVTVTASHLTEKVTTMDVERPSKQQVSLKIDIGILTESFVLGISPLTEYFALKYVFGLNIMYWNTLTGFTQDCHSCSMTPQNCDDLAAIILADGCAFGCTVPGGAPEAVYAACIEPFGREYSCEHESEDDHG